MANWINLLDVIYPIGSLYFSTKSASPSSSIGGAWNQIKDKTLVGCGENFAAGSIGGEIEHTLTIDEMPRHNHLMGDFWHTASNGNVQNGTYYGIKHDDYYTASTGGGSRIPICLRIKQYLFGKEQPSIFYEKGRC